MVMLHRVINAEVTVVSRMLSGLNQGTTGKGDVILCRGLFFACLPVGRLLFLGKQKK